MPGDLRLSGRPSTKWDHWDAGTDDGVVWGAKAVGTNSWFVALRGSVTLQDWIDDAEAVAAWSASLSAHVHPGFNWAIDKVWNKVKAIVGNDPWVATGHSLGAARADNLTAYAIGEAMPPAARVVFGEPRPGFADFCNLVAQAPGASFINLNGDGRDRVPAVPIDMITEPYRRPPRRCYRSKSIAAAVRRRRLLPLPPYDALRSGGARPRGAPRACRRLKGFMMRLAPIAGILCFKHGAKGSTPSPLPRRTTERPRSRPT